MASPSSYLEQPRDRDAYCKDAMPPSHAIWTPPETPSEQNKPTTAAELERLSAIVPEIVNARDFDFAGPEAQELLSHVAPDFASQIDTLPEQNRLLSWSGQLSAWRQRAQDNPNARFHVTAVSSVVDERLGFAQVFLEMDVSGIGDVKLHAMNELKWQRVDGKWLWFYVIGMRGTPQNSGFG